MLRAVVDACVAGRVAFDAAVIGDGVAWQRELVALLDAEALLAGVDPVTVFVAPAAPYPREARELLQVLEFLKRGSLEGGAPDAVPCARD